MRRPQRRLHLVIWLLIAPAIAAGLVLALQRSPADVASDLADTIITDAAR